MKHFLKNLKNKPAAILLSGIMMLLLPSISHASGIDSSWVKYADSSGVSIYYDTTQCNGNNVIFINFSNNNSYDVKIEWQDSMKAFGRWVNSSKKGTKSITVPAGTLTSNSCGNIKDWQCAMFSQKYLTVPNPKITGYKITTLTITQQ